MTSDAADPCRVRVLRIIARLNMGGPAHHVSLLSGRLDPERYETLLLHGRVGAGEASLADLARFRGATMCEVPGLGPELRPADDLRALRALIGHIRAFRPDIVHTHTAKAGTLGRMAAVAAGGRKRPIIVHTYHGHVLEGYFGRAKSAAFVSIEQALGRMSDCLLGVSAATVDDLVRLRVAPRAKFKVLPIGLELDRFVDADPFARTQIRTTLGVKDDDVLLTFVGRLVPIKRLDVLLAAVARARELGAPVALAVIGDGELRTSLERQVDELGLRSAVHFLGYRADIAAIVAAGDIGVLSSDNEGTPVSLIEAAAAGRPAVATDVGGVADVVTLQSGQLVAPGDSGALGHAIATLAGDSERRRAMGDIARAHVLEHFGVERLLRDMDNLYQELLVRLRRRQRSSGNTDLHRARWQPQRRQPGCRAVPRAMIEQVIKLESDEWDDAIERSGRAFRFSHRAAAGEALETAFPSYRYAPLKVVYQDGTTALFPLVHVIRRVKGLSTTLGLPMGFEGTPITLSGEVTAEHVYELYQTICRRTRLDIYGGAGGSLPRFGKIIHGMTHVLALDQPFDVLWMRSFSATNRNICRKAQRAGVRVFRDDTPAALKSYLELYESATRSWGHARPPYPRAMFEALLRSDAAELWLATVDARPVAGAVLLRGSHDLLYWSAAMDRAFRNVAPANALLRRVVESACERGLAYIDFGASDGLPGVAAFKASFGAQPREYCGVELSSRAYRLLERGHDRLVRKGASA